MTDPCEAPSCERPISLEKKIACSAEHLPAAMDWLVVFDEMGKRHRANYDPRVWVRLDTKNQRRVYFTAFYGHKYTGP